MDKDLTCPLYGGKCVGPDNCAPAVFHAEESPDGNIVCPITNALSMFNMMAIKAVSDLEEKGVIPKEKQESNRETILKNLQIDQRDD